MYRKQKELYTIDEYLDLCYTLPSDPEDSDVDPDEGAKDGIRIKEEIVEEDRTSHNSDIQPETSVNSTNSANNITGAPSTSRVNATSSSDESDIDVVKTEEDWSQDTSQFDSPAVDMNGEGEINPMLTQSSAERDFFLQIFNEEILEHIVLQTNLYATQVKQKRHSGHIVSESTQNWKDISKEELLAWIGMNIMMGIVVLPEIEHYWSSDPALGQRIVSDVMTCKRFKKIIETIHLSDNEANLPREHPDFDRLHKVRPLVTYLNRSIAAIKWMDNKPVTLLSTANYPRCTTMVNRNNKDSNSCEVNSPVATYNEIMGDVDHFDQLRERYAIGRHSRKWWHRILFFLIDLGIVNAFVLWKLSRRDSAPLDQLSFRLRLARQLIAGFSNRKRKRQPVIFLSKKKLVPEEIRLNKVGDHMPVSERTYRRCRLCSTKIHDKRTKYICKVCNVPLCVEPCFRKFHGK